jgi:cytochrome c oxidase subunit 2
MNCVPGMTTTFFIEPVITTDSMRLITGNDKFDYILLCNKICGAAHFNMRMKLVIDSPEDFKKWYKSQEFVFQRGAAPVTEPSAVKDTTAKQAEAASGREKPVIAVK